MDSSTTINLHFHYPMLESSSTRIYDNGSFGKCAAVTIQSGQIDLTIFAHKPEWMLEWLEQTAAQLKKEMEK